MSRTFSGSAADRKAYIITGPTSGIGRATALEMAEHGTLILVGRDRTRLAELQKIIEKKGQRAVSVVCDLSDLASVRRAAEEIIALGLPIAGLLNNAGIMPTAELKNASGMDLTFTTNHLGPFALTDALLPHLPDGANVVFVVSAIEDPERKPVKVMGLKGGRFISVEASARGKWEPGGSKMPGVDSYSTSKQCNLAAVFALAREMPRLHFNGVEPGINPSTGLGGANAVLRFIFGQIVTRLPPFARYRSTPEQAARVITKILTDTSGKTGGYFDERGRQMTGSTRVHDPKFQDLVVAETREFLAKHPTP
jgi:NAD(P)-dependent dehydrogenase (short-subunit alcohol dehydrogenase family)